MRNRQINSKKLIYKDYDIELIRSSRKSIAIEIDKNLRIKVRAPQRMPQYKILEFIAEKESWIRLHLEKMAQLQKQQEKEAVQSQLAELTPEELQRLMTLAKAEIPGRVKYFADSMGVTYGRITIRNQKTRWGSCSQAGNLNFNCHLVEMPPEILDYVVVHELCHRKQMNHSRLFWIEVEKVLPDYRLRQRWLKQNGGRYLR